MTTASGTVTSLVPEVVYPDAFIDEGQRLLQCMEKEKALLQNPWGNRETLADLLAARNGLAEAWMQKAEALPEALRSHPGVRAMALQVLEEARAHAPFLERLNQMGQMFVNILQDAATLHHTRPAYGPSGALAPSSADPVARDCSL